LEEKKMPELAEITRVSPVDAARGFGLDYFVRAHAQGINVSQLLEQDDPTSEYGSDDRDLDAFERMMEAAGIRVMPVQEEGRRASTWEEATKTHQRKAMVHEFLSRVWRQASAMTPMRPQTRSILLSGDAALNTITNMYTDDTTIRARQIVPPIPLDALVARTTTIEGADFRSLYIVDDLGTDAYRMKRVMEGTDIPATTLVSGEHYVQIHKFGRALLATYEQLRRQRIDRIAFIVARMALQAEVDKVSIALDTVVNGDGNANTSSTVLALTALDAAASAGTLTLKGWLTFITRFTNAYRPTVVLGQEASIMQLLMLPVNTVNGIPLVLLQNTSNRTSDAPALKLVAWDGRQTLERLVEAGGTVSEVDNFIRNQTALWTMTESEGFDIFDANGSKTLNING
jgi:hypothetical protein